MTTNPTHIPVWTPGDRFRKAREDAGLTQQELADAIGVDRKTISAYELDERKRPMKSIISAWALRCGVPREWLISGTASTRWRSFSNRSGPPFLLHA
jgi:transcriptional regulator with XRE-family HTH domain